MCATQVTSDQLARYFRNEELVQDIFPELSDDVREQLFISEICDSCFKEMFTEAS
jgi:hypothetical protein